jgi:hypothetical protein
MKKLLIVLIVSCCYLTVNAQRTLDTSWHGHWQGKLNIYNAKGEVQQQIPMQLNIQPVNSSDTLTWQLVYNTKDVRNYTLYFNTSKKQLLIDEHNSILLTAALYNNRLVSWFQVEGGMLQSTYTKIGNTITMEIMYSSLTQKLVSGGSNNIPEVIAFPINSYQIASLSRMP